MALAIVAQPVHQSAPVVAPCEKRVDLDLRALAEEISEDEGVGMPIALMLAALYRDGLTDYAEAWDRAAAAQRQAEATCPMCGTTIEGRQYYVGGRGYVYFDVCSGDGSHYSNAA